MPRTLIQFIGVVVFACIARAADFHVASTGDDSNPGTLAAPLRTIQHAADLAQPGDVITVHEGIYRERVAPRGGESDTNRITYQAAAREKVTITGSEVVKGWEKVGSDTWKVTVPNKFFGGFNPYCDLIHGDWFSADGRQHHTGAVYLNGEWLIEAANFGDVLKPVAARPMWYAKVDGAGGEYLVNIATISAGKTRVPATSYSTTSGELRAAPCSEGGQCLGWIRAGSWVKYEHVDFGARAESIEIRAASVAGGGDVEIRLNGLEGELLGTCAIAETGNWQKWKTFHAKIAPTSGEQTLCLVFRPHKLETGNTTIWAQFKGVNPNEANVEINVRKTVFTPEKTGINYITVRGFTLRNAATNWAPPTAGQIGLISAYWNKGWIIENNDIGYSKCSGVALGKYSDEWDGRAGTTEGYVGTLARALKNGWNKATVGSHVVRNNHIHHCEQTGIVGSLGCSFSTIIGNEIHDIHVHQLFSGAEMAGIKFHGAIDVTIAGNNIYRCGNVSGIWLDWMAQGARLSGNLMHDNFGEYGDIFFEMQHGPILVDNNLLLSKHVAFGMNAQGIAFVHNLIGGPIHNLRSDARVTPFQAAHSTELAGMYPATDGDSGDHRFYSNLFVAPCNLHAIDNSVLPCFAAGNVFTKGTQPSKFDVGAVVEPKFDAGVKLTKDVDGWYLTLSEDPAWRAEARFALVTTDRLGTAKVPNVAFETSNGTAIRIDTDYFGKKRMEANSFPGPFESGGKQRLKVWPIADSKEHWTSTR